MRLIFLVLKLNFETSGGSTYEVDKKIRSLMNCGHTATVITLFSQKNLLIDGLPYQVIQEQADSLSLLDLQSCAYHILKKFENQVDVFCVEGQFTYGSGLYCLRGGVVPVMAHFNRELSSFPESTRRTVTKLPFSLKKKIRFIVERLFGFPLINRNSLLTFTNPLLQELYISYGVKRKKTMVLPDFFDSQEMKKHIDAAGTLKRRSEQKNTWTIVTGGRMVPEKGLDIMIQAMACVSQPERFRLIVAGTGPEEANLRQLCRDLHIESLVSFPGWVSQESLRALFYEADIFVVPRWRPELGSLLTFEAMACMVPYIVTKSTALAWQADNSALQFEDEEYRELAKQVECLVGDPELRMKLVRNGLRRLDELDCRTITPVLDASLHALRK